MSKTVRDLSQDLQKDSFLGQESYGNVFRGRLTGIETKDVVVQVLKIPNNKSSAGSVLRAWEELKNVAGKWANLTHENVTEFLGIASGTTEQPSGVPQLMLVTPFIPNADVMNYLSLNPQVSTLPILQGLANGLAYLHNHGIVHGSLAPGNVLIKEDGQPCLTQYGLGPFMRQTGLLCSVVTDKRAPYASPEALEDPETQYTKEMDVYSYAMTSFEIVTRKPPFEDIKGQMAIFAAVVYQKQRPKRKRALNVDPRVWKLWVECWVHSAAARPTASTVSSSLSGISSDLVRCVSGSLDGSIRMWDLENGKEVTKHTVSGLPEIGRDSLALSPIVKGKLAVTTLLEAKSSRMMLLDLESKDQVWSNTSGCSCVAFSPDGAKVVSGSKIASVEISSADNGESVKQLIGHREKISNVKFSPDGTMIASASWDHTVKLWNSVTGGGALHTFTDHKLAVLCVAFSSDGQQLAAAGSDPYIIIWQVVTKTILKRLDVGGHWIRAVIFSPDGKFLASGGEQAGGVRLWNTTTGEILWTALDHSENISAVAFSSDGSLLASASADRTVRIWDVESGECLHVMKGHSREVSSVIFTL